MTSRRIDTWFGARGWRVFDFQREVWDAYLRGESGLVHAATGTGKTLAAWMGPLIEWLAEQPTRRAGDAAFDDDDAEASPTVARRKPRRDSAPGLRVLWITPLRALAADTAEALGAPVRSLGLPWTIETRTGDTPAALRARQRRKLPTALITTPESVSLLLSRDDAPELFGELRLVVVDEWHELLGTKRGVQTELALARLRALRPGLRIWGLYVGWTRGLAVASALGNPVLRSGPAYMARAAAAVAGIAIPLAAARVVGSDGLLLDGALAAGALIAVGLVRLHGRVEGWKLVLVLIALFALVSVIR